MCALVYTSVLLDSAVMFADACGWQLKCYDVYMHFLSPCITNSAVMRPPNPVLLLAIAAVAAAAAAPPYAHSK